MSTGGSVDGAAGAALININVDLKHASKAVIKLIDATSRGLGLLYEPTHVRRIAAAYKDASERLDGEPAARSLYERSVSRFLGQEIRSQQNIEGISAKAVDLMPSEVTEEPVDEDWVASFFGMCRTIRDEDMQTLWARILAGEVASPGTFSLRTLSTVKTLSKDEAEAFTLYCRYVCKDSNGRGRRIQNDKADKYLYEKVNLHGGYAAHFADIGLVSAGTSTLPTDDDTRMTEAHLVYFDRSVQLVKDQSAYPIPYLFGTEPLTAIGNELHSISGARPDYEYFDILVAALNEEGFVEKEREANRAAGN